MTIERKTFDSAGFKALDEASGVAEMIVSVFSNLDEGKDRVMPGFFAESIATRRTADGRPRAKGVWGHDWATPVAITLDARELLPGDAILPAHLRDLGGLWVKGQFNLDTQRGKEAFSDLRFGTIDEFSIGYSVKVQETDYDTGERRLIKGEWYEWSPVLVGMNDQTALLNVKQFAGLTLDAHFETAHAAVRSCVTRLRDLQELRAKEGRVLSSANRTRLASLKESLASVLADIDELLAATEPQKALDLSSLLAEYERTLFQISQLSN